MKTRRLLKPVLLALSLGLVTGCASIDQMNQAQADIAKAQQSADAAMTAAANAERKADMALSRADEAISRANAAQAKADECNERCSRIAEKAMAK